MYKFDDKFLRDLLKNYSRVIVRGICSQAEILEKDEQLSKIQALNLLKQFNKELIYQCFKDLEGQLKAYQVGKQFIKFDIYTPNPENKDS